MSGQQVALIRTRAASGINGFDALPERAFAPALAHCLVDITDGGKLTGFLASDAARHVTNVVIPLDGGQYVLA